MGAVVVYYNFTVIILYKYNVDNVVTKTYKRYDYIKIIKKILNSENCKN